MARAKFVKSARKDYPEHGIKKGESYWWWKFRFGGKHFSKTQPKASQLTQSSYLSTLYGIKEGLEGTVIENVDDFNSNKEDLISELESLRDECQENLDAMPENLRDNSSSGETLQERIDSIESALSSIESETVDIDEEDSEDEQQEKLEQAWSDVISHLDEL